MRDGKVLTGYQYIGCNMIFDINMDGNFTRKARFVAGGHTTDPPASINYSSVVSRDSAWIVLMLEALDDIDVFAANIGNYYLNDTCCEKIWTKYGPEFVSQQGCIMLIIRELYGLNYSGASWRAMLEETLGKDGICYTPTDKVKDVYIKKEVLPDRKEYYCMVLVYVDYFFVFKRMHRLQWILWQGRKHEEGEDAGW